MIAFILIGSILTYLGVGFVISFLVNYFAYKHHWLDETDRHFVAVAAIPGWPIIAPIVGTVTLYKSLRLKARELASK